VNLPEPGKNISSVVLVTCLFLGRFIALGEPVLLKELQQVFPGRWRGRVYPEETLDAGVQGSTEAEIPLVLRPETVDVLQFVAQGTRAVERNLGKAQGSDGYPPFVFSRLAGGSKRAPGLS
jgi:hypothetical protein